MPGALQQPAHSQFPSAKVPRHGEECNSLVPCLRGSVRRSLVVHKSFCSEATRERCQEDTVSAITCRYCDKTWPSQRSLSQHVRNQHMAESQQDRLEDLSGEPSGNQRRIWTDERRQAFLEVADRVGWSNHSVITAELDMSIRQIRNYKLKFPRIVGERKELKSQWKRKVETPLWKPIIGCRGVPRCRRKSPLRSPTSSSCWFAQRKLHPCRWWRRAIRIIYGVVYGKYP